MVWEEDVASSVASPGAPEVPLAAGRPPRKGARLISPHEEVEIS